MRYRVLILTGQDVTERIEAQYGDFAGQGAAEGS